MEIRKDERNKIHRKVAILTSSFLLLILGVTVLGMNVFSPQQSRTNLRELARLNSDRGALIGSPTAQAAEGELLPDLDEKLDGLADSLEDVIQDAGDSHPTVNGEAENSTEETEKEASGVETAIETGRVTWNLWSLLWDVLWPRVHTFANALWSSYNSSGN